MTTTALAPRRSLARRVLPSALRKRLYAVVHAVRVRRLPDRRFMESEILPWLADRHCGDVLFVGCRAYTRHYGRLFARRGIRLWTMDVDPAAADFGCKGHVVKSIAELAPGDFPVAFDAVIFNGVIGWGLDRTEDIERSFSALSRVMKPGAALVLGWNTDRSDDPLRLLAQSRLFQTLAGPAGGRRVTFEDVTHVYDFLASPGHRARTPPTPSPVASRRLVRAVLAALGILTSAGALALLD